MFTVSSDESYGATTTAPLRRAAVTMDVASVDDAGLPLSYTATVVFRGEERYLEQVGWHVTGTYTGSLSKRDVLYLTTVTYASEAPAAAGTEQGQTPERAGFFDALGSFISENGRVIAAVFGAGIAVALLATATVLYKRRREHVGEGGRHAA